MRRKFVRSSLLLLLSSGVFFALACGVGEASVHSASFKQQRSESFMTLYQSDIRKLEKEDVPADASKAMQRVGSLAQTDLLRWRYSRALSAPAVGEKVGIAQKVYVSWEKEQPRRGPKRITAGVMTLLGDFDRLEGGRVLLPFAEDGEGNVRVAAAALEGLRYFFPAVVQAPKHRPQIDFISSSVLAQLLGMGNSQKLQGLMQRGLKSPNQPVQARAWRASAFLLWMKSSILEAMEKEQGQGEEARRVALCDAFLFTRNVLSRTFVSMYRPGQYPPYSIALEGDGYAIPEFPTNTHKLAVHFLPTMAAQYGILHDGPGFDRHLAALMDFFGDISMEWQVFGTGHKREVRYPLLHDYKAVLDRIDGDAEWRWPDDVVTVCEKLAFGARCGG